MYLKKIQMENVGPIDHLLDIDIPFHKDDQSNDTNPKPLIIVGKNGSGKTLFFSSIIDAYHRFKDYAGYNDAEFAKEQMIKTSRIDYITSGKEYYYTFVRYNVLDQALLSSEILSIKQIKEYDDSSALYNSNYEIFEHDNNFQNEIKQITDRYFYRPINMRLCKEAINNYIFIYFPSERSEKPAWINEDADLQPVKKLNLSRPFITKNCAKDIYEWLVRIIQNEEAVQDSFYKNLVLFIIEIFKKILADDSVNLKLHPHIGIIIETQTKILYSLSAGKPEDSLTHLSAGELSILFLFLSILKDYERLPNLPEFFNQENIKGIVLIDEIDLHLHPTLQHKVLPKLIKMFPKIQFIMTTHSPLFLLGMEKEFGTDNYQIIELPSGKPIDCEEFKEFEKAYDFYIKTKKFNDNLEQTTKTKLEELLRGEKNLLIIEDETLIDIWKNLLQEYQIDLEKFEIMSSKGCRNDLIEEKFLDIKKSHNEIKVKIYRIIDRDGLPRELDNKLYDIYKRFSDEFNYKIKLLDVFEIENFILLDKLYETTEFYEKKNNITEFLDDIYSNDAEFKLEIAFKRQIQDKISQVIGKNSKDLIKFETLSIHQMLDNKKYFLNGKEIISQMNKTLNLSFSSKDCLQNLKRKDFPDELTSLLEEIKIFFTDTPQQPVSGDTPNAS